MLKTLKLVDTGTRWELVHEDKKWTEFFWPTHRFFWFLFLDGYPGYRAGTGQALTVVVSTECPSDPQNWQSLRSADDIDFVDVNGACVTFCHAGLRSVFGATEFDYLWFQVKPVHDGSVKKLRLSRHSNGWELRYLNVCWQDFFAATRNYFSYLFTEKFSDTLGWETQALDIYVSEEQPDAVQGWIRFEFDIDEWVDAENRSLDFCTPGLLCVFDKPRVNQFWIKAEVVKKE